LGTNNPSFSGTSTSPPPARSGRSRLASKSAMKGDRARRDQALIERASTTARIETPEI
jgi:hypothetical protein